MHEQIERVRDALERMRAGKYISDAHDTQFFKDVAEIILWAEKVEEWRKISDAFDADTPTYCSECAVEQAWGCPGSIKKGSKECTDIRRKELLEG